MRSERAASDSPTATVDAGEVRREQWRLFLRNQPLAIAGNATATLIMAAWLLRHMPADPVIVWAGLAILVLAVRALALWHPRQDKTVDHAPSRRHRWIAVISVLSAAVWGLGLPVVLPADNVTLTVVAAGFLVGLDAAALSTSAARYGALAGFILAGNVPFILFLMIADTPAQTTIALAMIVLTAVMLGGGWRLAGQIRDMIAARLSQQTLVDNLEDARQAAESASRAKTAFLASMSHELRTPMNAIIGLLRLLKKTELDGAQDNYVRKIDDAAQGLLRIIDDVLDFANAEAGALNLSTTVFAYSTVLDRVIELQGLRAQQKGLSLRCETKETVPAYLRGDPNRLGQILLNLVGNAIKFTDAGEIVISTRVLRRTADGVILAISVRDTGIGLTPEQKQRIFSFFAQGDASRTRKHGGTGLGLAVARRFLAIMGGTIDVRSRPGEGSTFTIDVPLGLPDAGTVAQHDAAERGPATADGRQRLCGLRLLVVEDNDINQEVARHLLEADGAEVTVVDDGAHVMNALYRAPHDGVLMDIQMPNIDGYIATQRIRAEPLFKDLPVIAMTAHATADAHETSIAAGMDDHLSKPVQPATLYETLRAWLPDRRRPADTDPLALETAATTTTGEPVAYPGLDTDSGLRNTAGRPAMYARMLRRFRDRYDDGATPLRAHLDAGERDAAHRWAHSLKGLAQTIGADDVAAAAAHVDGIFKDGGTPDDDDLSRLAAALRAIDTAIDRYLADATDLDDRAAS